MLIKINRLEYHDLEFGIDPQDVRKTLTGCDVVRHAF